MVKCPAGTILNEETGKCVLVDGRVGKRILLERKLKRSPSRKSPRRDKKCPPGKILNPDTEICVLADGRVGKRILLEKKLKRSPSRKSPRRDKKCPSGTILNKETGNCVLVDGRVGKRILLERKLKRSPSRKSPRRDKKCPSGTILNEETGNCVLVDGKVGKRILLKKKLQQLASSLQYSQTNTSSSVASQTNTTSSSVALQTPSSTNTSSSSGSLQTPIITPRIEYLTSPAPKPRVHFNFDRVPPKDKKELTSSPSPSPSPSELPITRRPSRSPSPFTRSPSPSRLPPRIEPTSFILPPSIPETYDDFEFPDGPGNSSVKIDPYKLRNDCNYLNQWIVGELTGSGAVGTTRIIKHKKHRFKYILKKQKRDNQYSSQFTSEIKALVALQGTNLVPKIYDAWTCGSWGYIIMERLYNCSTVDPRQLYTKVGDKLKDLRKLGWLHVDTHDGNVMCTESKEPVIIDFGYAVERKDGGDNATYPKHPKSQPIKQEGWGVALPWKFLEVLQEVNFHESFNPYGSKFQKIKRTATREDITAYKNMQKRYKDAQKKLRDENGYRYRGIVLDQMSLQEENDYRRGIVLGQLYSHNLNE